MSTWKPQLLSTQAAARSPKRNNIVRSTSPLPMASKFNTLPSIISSNTVSTALSESADSAVDDRRVSGSKALDLGPTFLEINVGKSAEKRHFFIHELLVTSRSGFLRSAVDTKSLVKSATVLEDDPDIFNLYISLIYSGNIPTRGPHEWLKLCRLYLLVEKLQDTRAKNDIINAMHGFIKEFIPKEPSKGLLVAQEELTIETLISAASIEELYRGTPEGSPARKLVLDLYADHGQENWLQAGRVTLPFDFLFDLAVIMTRKRPYTMFGSMLNRPSSAYHEVIAIEKTGSADVVTASAASESTEFESATTQRMVFSEVVLDKTLDK